MEHNLKDSLGWHKLQMHYEACLCHSLSGEAGAEKCAGLPVPHPEPGKAGIGGQHRGSQRVEGSWNRVGGGWALGRGGDRIWHTG